MTVIVNRRMFQGQMTLEVRFFSSFVGTEMTAVGFLPAVHHVVMPEPRLVGEGKRTNGTVVDRARH